MDLRGRLRLIESRLYTLETVARMRSAAISEGTTEFTGEGQLVIEDGGTFIIDDGGAISGSSWELGVNEDGTTYANLGDVLLHTHDAPPITEYITLGSVPTILTDPITKVSQPLPEGAEYAVVVGTLNVMAEDDTRTIARVRSHDTDISIVIQEGQTQSIPLIMRFDDMIEFEIHVTKSFEVDSSFEAIYHWKVPADAETEQVTTG